MKFYLLLLSFLFTSFAIAQVDKNPDKLPARIFELKVKTFPPGSLKLPFEYIKVIDCRFDKSILGFRHNLLAGFGKIALTPTVEDGIEEFYNEYYHRNFTDNGKVLLISIKKLWINNEPDIQSKYRNKDMDETSSQDIYAKFEYYYGSDSSFSPIKRIDTLFQLTPMLAAREFEAKDEDKLPFLCFALEKMIENVNYDLYLKNVENKRKMSVEDIEKYNAGSFNIPILNEPVKQGVFLTFEEFKNNQPSIITFGRKRIKNRMFEIVDDKGNMIFRYFAYYDGKNLVITKHLSRLLEGNSESDNYIMFRSNNTFQFFQNNSSKVPSTVVIVTPNYVVPIPVNNTRKYLIPRQIDMETGIVY